MRPQIPSSTSLPYPSQIIHGKNSSDSLTDLQSEHVFDRVFRLQMSAWIEKTTCYGRRVGAVVLKKVGRIWGRAIVHLSRTHFHTWNPDPTPGSPTLMPSTPIPHFSKFTWVTWLLLSKALARTCTLQRSGEAGTVKDLQHHACTVATSMRASNISYFLEKFSSAMQVSFRTVCQRLAMQSSKKMVALLLLEWFDDPCSSFFRSLHAFTSVRPASQARSSQWTEPHVFGSGPHLL